jgi:hypothetical protein
VAGGLAARVAAGGEQQLRRSRAGSGDNINATMNVAAAKHERRADNAFAIAVAAGMTAFGLAGGGIVMFAASFLATFTTIAIWQGISSRDVGSGDGQDTTSTAVTQRSATTRRDSGQ